MVLIPIWQVAEMLDLKADEREDSPMRLALVQGGTGMQRLFARRLGQLKAKWTDEIVLYQ